MVFFMKNKCNKCGQEYQFQILTNGPELVIEKAPEIEVCFLTFCTNRNCEHFEIVKSINNYLIKFDD